VPEQKGSPAAQKLAGKRATRPVMRTGSEDISPRVVDNNDIRREKLSAVDACSRDRSLPQMGDAPDRALRGLEQRREALLLANGVRFARADIRRQLGRGELHFDVFMDELPSCCAEVPLIKVLCWLPNIGRPKAKRMLAAVNREVGSWISGDTRMEEVPTRAKYLLSEMVQRETDAYERRCARRAA
jgi:hypothetical protein